MKERVEFNSPFNLCSVPPEVGGNDIFCPKSNFWIVDRRNIEQTYQKQSFDQDRLLYLCSKYYIAASWCQCSDMFLSNQIISRYTKKLLQHLFCHFTNNFPTRSERILNRIDADPFAGQQFELDTSCRLYTDMCAVLPQRKYFQFGLGKILHLARQKICHMLPSCVQYK